MCGLAGLARAVVTPEDTATVERMCERIRHRGPDDVGVQTCPGAVLGLARLSIIDVPGGHQPLSNETGSVWVALNGEIYNYVELRQELGGRHRLRTGTDTEVLAHLYEDLGVGLHSLDACDQLRSLAALEYRTGPPRDACLARGHGDRDR